ncbi:DNA polymerase III subunit beta [Romboutsia sp.]|uniref:DNA polymerase III subunit beta n=1 Tax=Romboutsia sp. TaxID=1965302 RepID=UPI002C1E5593|nr:DNA polymerase III subunit beta [Romboutsia sp.]HSQ89677.1 DNA polymerase III subunit beta [Romboutsia sp.]
MKFKINKNDILDILSKVQGITGRKSNLAITSNILIKTTDKGIILTVTDLETGFEGLYPATIEKKGVLTINSRKFYEIVREFPSEEIQISESDNYWIKIGNKNVEYNMVGLNPDDFPETPIIENVDFFTIDSEVFRKMIEKTIIITGASDEKRTHITGIYFEVIHQEDKNLVRMVSTDGNRLSKADCIYEKDIQLPQAFGVLIPKKGMNEVIKFLDPSGTVQIGVKNNNFIIKKDYETVIIRLLEGDFPEYGDIIQRGSSYAIHLDKKKFLMMLKRMSILSSEDYKGVIFNFKDNNISITTTNPDLGESKEDMNIDFKGDPIEVAFNPRYIIEILSVIDTEKVVVNIIDKEKPCLIEGENDDTYLSVIMPMRI